MDENQQARFKEAVDRKAAESEAASRATQHQPPGEAGDIHGDQDSLRSPAQTQDAFSARDKNSRHRKVTADKWNQ